MKKLLMAIMVACIFFAGWLTAGHCGIEQEEGAMDAKLEGNMAGDRADDAVEMGQMEQAVDGETGAP